MNDHIFPYWDDEMPSQKAQREKDLEEKNKDGVANTDNQ